MPNDRVLIVGGGPAGLSAARGLIELGVPVTVVESREFLGGMPIIENYAALTPHFESAEVAMQRMIDAVTPNPLTDLRLSSRVVSSEGGAGAFRVTVESNGTQDVVEAGSVIIATGFQHFDPGRETQMYGYYEYPDVLALQDLEAMLKEHKIVRPSNGESPKRLCFIQCVGSRDRRLGNEYCSKVCCGIASKEAIEVREQLPDCKVFIFYIDMRMYGYWENQIYWPAQEKHHVQYVKGIVTEILRKGDRLLVRGEDTTMGRPMEIPMDMVVLSVGMEPSKGTRDMAEVFGVTQNKYGFVEIANPPLDTATTNVEGVFVCGAAIGPADLEDSVGSAGLAAMKAASLVRRMAAVAPA